MIDRKPSQQFEKKEVTANAFSVNPEIFNELTGEEKGKLAAAYDSIEKLNARLGHPLPEISEHIEKMQKSSSITEFRELMKYLVMDIMTPVFKKAQTSEVIIGRFFETGLSKKLSPQIEADIKAKIQECYEDTDHFFTLSRRDEGGNIIVVKEGFKDRSNQIEHLAEFCGKIKSISEFIRKYRNEIPADLATEMNELLSLMHNPETGYEAALKPMNQMLEMQHSFIDEKEYQDMLKERRSSIGKQIDELKITAAPSQLSLLNRLQVALNSDGDVVSGADGLARQERLTPEYFNLIQKQVESIKVPPQVKKEASKDLLNTTPLEVTSLQPITNTNATKVDSPIEKKKSSRFSKVVEQVSSVRKMLNSKAGSLFAGGLLGVATSLTPNILDKPRDLFLNPAEVSAGVKALERDRNGNTYNVLLNKPEGVDTSYDFAKARAESMTTDIDVQKQKTIELVEQIEQEKNNPDNLIVLLRALGKVQPDQAQYLESRIKLIESNKNDSQILQSIIAALLGSIAGLAVNTLSSKKDIEVVSTPDDAKEGELPAEDAKEDGPVTFKFGDKKVTISREDYDKNNYINNRWKKIFGSSVIDSFKVGYKTRLDDEKKVLTMIVKELERLIKVNEIHTPKAFTQYINEKLIGITLPKWLSEGKINQDFKEFIEQTVEKAKKEANADYNFKGKHEMKVENNEQDSNR